MHEPTDNLKCRIRTPAAVKQWLAEIDHPPQVVTGAEDEDAYWATRLACIETDSEGKSSPPG